MQTCLERVLSETELCILSARQIKNDIELSILEEVCLVCCVFVEDVQAPNKGKREVCDARHIAATLIQKYSTLSYDNIGKKVLGGRDHSTIIHSLRVTQSLLDYDKVFKAKFIQCETAIRTKFYL